MFFSSFALWEHNNQNGRQHTWIRTCIGDLFLSIDGKKLWRAGENGFDEITLNQTTSLIIERAAWSAALFISSQAYTAAQFSHVNK